MIKMETILEQLTGKPIADALIETLSANFEDFSAAKARYDEAICRLREEIGDAVQDEIAAIDQQTASTLLFSGLLGLKANWDHFLDPVARNFLDVDAETYLRETTARRLPAYRQAQAVRCRFYALLTPEQQKRHEDITAYVSYLETAGPKLAHYWGYLLGDDLLQRTVPGYHPDPVLTMRYRMMLEAYFPRCPGSSSIRSACSL